MIFGSRYEFKLSYAPLPLNTRKVGNYILSFSFVVQKSRKLVLLSIYFHIISFIGFHLCEVTLYISIILFILTRALQLYQMHGITRMNDNLCNFNPI